jgi:nucleotide-binding universal stress UspA family protein
MTFGDSPSVGRMPAVERYGPRWAPPPFERGTDGPRVILVGVDGSDGSLRAAAYACGLARRQRCHLVVAYAITLGFWWWAIPGGAAVVLRTVDEIEAQLRADFRRAAEEIQIPISFISRRSDPYGCLRAVADEVNADTVVVGSTGQTRRLFGGSVAGRLIRLGRWPITVVP